MQTLRSQEKFTVLSRSLKCHPLSGSGLIALLLILLQCDVLATGSTLAINFQYTTGKTVTAPAFGVPTNVWYNAPAGVANTNNVTVTNSGTAVTLSWSASGTYADLGLSGAGDNEVFFGYLDDGPNGSIQGNAVIISNLNAAFR